MLFTIQQFSSKTGLPSSTLRYYDKKKLLQPERRLENGYRAYHDSQIAEALMIHSLRNADIPIDEIKRYLAGSEVEKNGLISKWRKEIQAKLSTLQVAKQYLGGLSPKQNQMYLVRWEERVSFLWHKCTVGRKFQPFKEVMYDLEERLLNGGVKLAPGYFVRVQSSIGKKITGEVGFIIENVQMELQENEYIETLEPTLFASMECSAGNEFLCFQFIQMMKQYGFVPDGQKLEKYDTPESELFQYLIPILKNGGAGNG